VRRTHGESDILCVANSHVQGKLQEALVAVTQLGSVSFPRIETSNGDVAFHKAELDQLAERYKPLPECGAEVEHEASPDDCNSDRTPSPEEIEEPATAK